MPRPAGRRNADYEEKRTRILAVLTDHVLAATPTRIPFRQYAQIAGVSEPTLKHYFGDREDLAIDILVELGRRATPFMKFVAQPSPRAADIVSGYVALSQAGVASGAFAHAHCFGIVEGVADPRVGRAYLDHLLEPSILALEARLAPVLPTGDPVERRAAALALFSPMLLAVIHQQLLGGAHAAPMELPAVFEALGRFGAALPATQPGP